MFVYTVIQKMESKDVGMGVWDGLLSSMELNNANLNI